MGAQNLLLYRIIPPEYTAVLHIIIRMIGRVYFAGRFKRIQEWSPKQSHSSLVFMTLVHVVHAPPGQMRVGVLHLSVVGQQSTMRTSMRAHVYRNPVGSPCTQISNLSISRNCSYSSTCCMTVALVFRSLFSSDTSPRTCFSRLLVFFTDWLLQPDSNCCSLQLRMVINGTGWHDKTV